MENSQIMLRIGMGCKVRDEPKYNEDDRTTVVYLYFLASFFILVDIVMRVII